jgi:hypothetical protein
MRIFGGICAVALVVLIAGCASYMPVNSVPTGLIYTGSTGPIGISVGNHSEYKIIGQAVGRSSAVGVLGVVGVGDAGASSAYQDAIRSTRADALIDVQVDQKIISILGLFTKHTTIVRGTAIQYVK